MVGNPQKPPDNCPSLRIKLIPALQGAREGLRDKIENEIRVWSDPAAQITPDQRVASLIQQRKPLRAAAD